MYRYIDYHKVQHAPNHFPPLPPKKEKKRKPNQSRIFFNSDLILKCG